MFRSTPDDHQGDGLAGVETLLLMLFFVASDSPEQVHASSSVMQWAFAALIECSDARRDRAVWAHDPSRRGSGCKECATAMGWDESGGQTVAQRK